MYFHPVFLIIPTLIAAFVGGISFAIVGRGNRQAWMFVAPLVVFVWFFMEQVIFSLVSTDTNPTNPLSRQFLVAILCSLCLPGILCVTAWAFRRWRERD